MVPPGLEHGTAVASTCLVTARGLDPSSRRRAIAALAGLAAMDFALGALVQTGVIRRLPDPPIRGIDSHRVMTSPAAYPFGVPDAPIALAVNALVLGLAGAANRGSGRRRRVIDRLLGVTVCAGSLGVLHYLAEMVRLRRACVYCLAAATAMLAMVPLALGNARLSGPIRSRRRCPAG